MSVYLDNAATTQIAPEVIDFMIDLMKSDYANPSSYIKVENQNFN